ncbi:hypothetical protein FZW96_13845 [Bacillus sp. BGMRC 2118]|nr:hypothetical protein FZW96_13845 [Bacillus sp. BGMRC 2118]
MIIDVSGLYSIDLVLVDFLYKLSSILVLLGVRAICTGIRAELAMKLVQSVSRDDIQSLHAISDLETALQYINRQKK